MARTLPLTTVSPYPQADATNASLARALDTATALQGLSSPPFDIIVDDALHDPDHMIVCHVGLQPQTSRPCHAGLEPQTSRPSQACYKDVGALPWTGFV